jgi:hypothetical protein
VTGAGREAGSLFLSARRARSGRAGRERWRPRRGPRGGTLALCRRSGVAVLRSACPRAPEGRSMPAPTPGIRAGEGRRPCGGFAADGAPAGCRGRGSRGPRRGRRRAGSHERSRGEWQENERKRVEAARGCRWPPSAAGDATAGNVSPQVATCEAAPPQGRRGARRPRARRRRLPAEACSRPRTSAAERGDHAAGGIDSRPRRARPRRPGTRRPRPARADRGLEPAGPEGRPT